jgi:transposase
MLDALVGGAQDAEALAELARGRLWVKLPALRLALEGRVQPHHRFLLTRILAQVQQEIEQRLSSAMTSGNPHL